MEITLYDINRKDNRFVIEAIEFGYYNVTRYAHVDGTDTEFEMNSLKLNDLKFYIECWANNMKAHKIMIYYQGLELLFPWDKSVLYSIQ